MHRSHKVTRGRQHATRLRRRIVRSRSEGFALHIEREISRELGSEFPIRFFMHSRRCVVCSKTEKEGSRSLWGCVVVGCGG